MNATLLLTLLLVAPAQTSGNRTTGTCSPIVASAQTVIVSGCGLGTVQAKKLQDSIQRAISQNNLTLAQVQILVTMLNSVVEQNVGVSQKLDRIIADIEASSTRTPGFAGSSSGLVREVLDRTVQKVDVLKITLTKIEGSAGHISIYFDLVNEGVVELRNINIFGGGSLGNGGSSIILSGQEILATRVEFAGKGNQGLIRSDIVPRVRYSGTVNFDGVYGDIANIDVFKLALSNNNLRPSARAT